MKTDVCCAYQIAIFEFNFQKLTCVSIFVVVRVLFTSMKYYDLYENVTAKLADKD